MRLRAFSLTKLAVPPFTIGVAVVLLLSDNLGGNESAAALATATPSGPAPNVAVTVLPPPLIQTPTPEPGPRRDLLNAQDAWVRDQAGIRVEAPSAHGLTAHIKDRVGNMMFGLDVVTGAKPCRDMCIFRTDLPTVLESAFNLCLEFDPRGLRASPLFDAKQHGAFVDAMSGACARLSLGEANLGAPADTPEWRQTAAEARDILGQIRSALGE